MRILREILSLIGFSMSFYGLYTVYEPVAFVVAGVFLMFVSVPSEKK